MKASKTTYVIVPLALGAALGVFLADAVWWDKNNSVLEAIGKIPLLEGVLVTPAMVLLFACAALHIGPSGDAGWDMLPYCLIAVWSGFGFATGMCIAYFRRRKKKQPNQAPEPTSTAVTPPAGRLRRATPGEPAGDLASGTRGSS